MLAAYLITGFLLAVTVFFTGSPNVRVVLSRLFFVLQVLFALWLIFIAKGATSLDFFTFDNAGILFFALLSIISPLVHQSSLKYLDKESPRQKRIYHSLLLMLSLSMACVYFSNNLAVTWIFLEATTLCTAGIIYHRRTDKSLEATWKYIFVCSVGIAIAYLGVLLLGGLSAAGDMSYSGLSQAVQGGNPLFMKIAFLFILVGYSCKMEVFPLYTIGVDANFAAPAPASALISTCLVNAGFLSVFRVYKIMEGTEIFGWICSVLIITGILSVVIGAMFMRRTGHYKRLLSYSTVENMGIAAIGLGIGGAGAFAALFHVAAHSLIKSSMFLQIARVGKVYGTYRMSRTGDYMKNDSRAASLLLLTSVLLMAFPPSPLFISEIMIFGRLASTGRWWLLAAVVLLICIVMYNFLRHILRLCYQPYRGIIISDTRIPLPVSIALILLLAATVMAGIWQPEWLVQWITAITG